MTPRAKSRLDETYFRGLWHYGWPVVVIATIVFAAANWIWRAL